MRRGIGNYTGKGNKLGKGKIIGRDKMLEEVYQRYKEFGTYLEQLDLEQVKENYERKEIREYADRIREISLRSVAWELDEVEKKMKEDELPELKKAHRYPIINEVSFLSEEEKVDLDIRLARIGKGKFTYPKWITRGVGEKGEELIAWLVKRGVIEGYTEVICGRCYQGLLGRITLEQSGELGEIVRRSPNNEREDYEWLLNNLQEYCSECTTSVEEMVDQGTGLMENKDAIYKMLIEQDRSLANK